MKHFRRSILCLLLVLLLAAAALTGCAQTEPASTEAPKTETQSQTPETKAPETKAPETDAPETDALKTDAPETEPVVTETAPAEAPTEAGEGDKLFYFEVTFSNGETTSYAVHTDAETVGEALVALDLVQGEMAQYGLYVTTIGGETCDYLENGMYWAFYEGGEYAMTSVDLTPITEGQTYAFVATKG
jgi:cytoskeletal protein RodZ